MLVKYPLALGIPTYLLPSNYAGLSLLKGD